MKFDANQRIHDVLLDIHEDVYKIPNIQRGFEWDKKRIIELLDSIMNGYPFGSIMLWKPSAKIRSRITDRSFVKDFSSYEDYLSNDAHLSDPESYLVLDGQQRLQSLYISFFGSYDGERAYMAIDHIPSPEADDDGYDFQFLTNKEAEKKPNMIPLGKIVELDSDTKSDFSEELAIRLTESISDNNERQRIQIETRKKIEKNIDKFIDHFNVLPLLLFQEISSKLTYDHVLEIFERVNSGGMVLNKSDLLFSTIKLKLKEMEENFNDTLNFISSGKNYGSRYEFNTDFIIKTSLVIFGKGAKYDLKKLRDEDYLHKLKEHYNILDTCLRHLVYWLENTALIKCDRFLPSKLALIPLIDYMMLSGNHKSLDEFNSQAMKQYLYMAFYTRLFGRSSDAMLDRIHNQLILSIKGDASAGILPLGADFPINSLKSLIKDKTRADYALYSDFFVKNADLMLNIVDGGRLQIDPKHPNLDPIDLKLEVDHIFPRSRLLKENLKESLIDHLGNYRLILINANRKKLAKIPEYDTSFFGKDDKKIASDYFNLIKDFNQNRFNKDNYLAFISRREALIQARVESFLDLKVIRDKKS